MKKLLIVLSALLLLCGCELHTEPELTPEPTPNPTPEHSELYIPGLSVDDVILYFNEVCLDSEYSSSGDPSKVQKWIIPIKYRLEGSYTQEDAQLIQNFSAWLNELVGFPGMAPTGEHEAANMLITFCADLEFADIVGSEYVGMDGAVTYWYDNDEIYDCVICCREDMARALKNSVVLEEVYNSLGPMQDTMLRPDSIIYQNYSEPQALTMIDELIIRLLYHPDMKCGMGKDECATVIRALYY